MFLSLTTFFRRYVGLMNVVKRSSLNNQMIIIYFRLYKI